MKKTILFISILAVGAFILYQGTRNLDTSLAFSDIIVNKCLAFILNDPQLSSPEYFELYPYVNYYIRKLAHFTEYALLGFVFCYYFSKRKQLRLDIIVYSLLPTLVIAVLDEFLQKYSGRGSLVSDVFIDGFGGLFGLTTFFILHKVKSILFKPKKVVLD